MKNLNSYSMVRSRNFFHGYQNIYFLVWEKTQAAGILYGCLHFLPTWQIFEMNAILLHHISHVLIYMFTCHSLGFQTENLVMHTCLTLFVVYGISINLHRFAFSTASCSTIKIHAGCFLHINLNIINNVSVYNISLHDHSSNSVFIQT